VRSVESQGGRTTTREYWQSADHPGQAREILGGAQRYEVSGDAVYDPATDTIYDAPSAKEGPIPAGKVDPRTSVPPSDPIVAKVRILLRNGDMEVTGREVHNGIEAWAISLKQGVGRPVCRRGPGAPRIRNTRVRGRPARQRRRGSAEADGMKRGVDQEVQRAALGAAIGHSCTVARSGAPVTTGDGCPMRR
jgi:hypothetical protein